MRRSGLTLAEIIITAAVLFLFLSGVYALFFGGQRISSKAAWAQYTITNLQTAERALTKAIQSSSYPSTLTPGRVYDAGGEGSTSATHSKNYYIHFPAGIGKIQANQAIAAKDGLLILYTASCQPEKQDFPSGNTPLTITWNCFVMRKNPVGENLGELFWEVRNATYSTSAPNFALGLSVTPEDATLTSSKSLVQDVEWIQFDVPSAGHKPQLITITIHCSYPRDSKFFKRSVSAAMPNVGIAIGNN